MTPAPGERLLRFVGDRVRFTLRDGGPPRSPAETNAARGVDCSAPILAAPPPAAVKSSPPTPAAPAHAGASWHDVPMQKTGDGWEIELPLAEAGFFKAKAYLLDAKGWQHWPDGPDVGISVHPNFRRTANTIYCAFTRLFGATKHCRRGRGRKTGGCNSTPSTRKVTPSFRPPENCATWPGSCRTSSNARLPHPATAAGASDADDFRALRTLRQSVCRAGFDGD